MSECVQVYHMQPQGGVVPKPSLRLNWLRMLLLLLLLVLVLLLSTKKHQDDNHQCECEGHIALEET